MSEKNVVTASAEASLCAGENPTGSPLSLLQTDCSQQPPITRTTTLSPERLEKSYGLA